MRTLRLSRDAARDGSLSMRNGLRNRSLRPRFSTTSKSNSDSAFSIFDGQRQIGIGIKGTDRTGRRHLYWIKLSDMQRYADETMAILIPTIQRYAIPATEYGE